MASQAVAKSSYLDPDNLRIEVAILQEPIEAFVPSFGKFKIASLMADKSEIDQSNKENYIEIYVPFEYTFCWGADMVAEGTRFLVASIGGNINDMRVIGKYDYNMSIPNPAECLAHYIIKIIKLNEREQAILKACYNNDKKIACHHRGFACLPNILSIVPNPYSEVLGAVGGIGSGLTESLGAVGSLGNDLVNSITNSVGNISGLAGELTGLGSGISNALGGLTNGLSEGLSNALGGLTNGLGNVLGGITSGLDNALNGIMGSLGNINNSLSGLSNLANSLGSELLNNLGGLGEVLNGNLGGVGDMLGNLTNITNGLNLSNLTGGLGDTLNNLTGELGNALNNLSGGLGDALNNLSGNLGDGLNNIINNLGDGSLSNVLNSIAATAGINLNELGSVLNNLSNMNELVSNTGANISNTIAHTINGVTNTSTLLPTKSNTSSNNNMTYDYTTPPKISDVNLAKSADGYIANTNKYTCLNKDGSRSVTNTVSSAVVIKS